MAEYSYDLLKKMTSSSLTL